MGLCCGVWGPSSLVCNHQWGLAYQMFISIVNVPEPSMEPIIDDQTYSNTNYARMLLDQVVKSTSTVKSRHQQNQHMDVNLETPASSGHQGQGFPPASLVTEANVALAGNSTQDQKRKASEMLQNHRVKRQRLTSTASGTSTPPSSSLEVSLPFQKAILPALHFQMDGMRLSPSLESPMSASGSSRSTTVGLREVRYQYLNIFILVNMHLFRHP